MFRLLLIVAAVSCVLTYSFTIDAQSGTAFAPLSDTELGRNDTELGGYVKPGHALHITIGGEMRLSMVSRNRSYFQAALGNATNGAALELPLGRGGTAFDNTGANPATGGDFWFDPFLSIDMDFQLADKVHAVFTLETPFNVFEDAGGSNTVVTSTVATDSSNRFLEVEQAYVDYEHSDRVSFRFGVQDYAKDFTGRRSPVFIDVSHSESPFLNPGFLPSVGVIVDYGAPQAPSAGLVGSQEAAGALLNYQLSQSIEVDVFYFTILESFRRNSDDTVFGVTLEQGFDFSDLRGQYGVILSGMQNDSSSYLWTAGIGGSAVMMGDLLEIYGETYGQWGQYVENAGATVVPGSALAAGIGNKDIKQRDAFAVYGGMRYYFPGQDDPNRRPFVDLSYWEFSGDHDGDDAKNSNFVSMENNNDTIVVEDGYYGLDIDTNYRAAKIRIGYSPDKEWAIDLLYAYFELQSNNGTADNTPAEHDKIGDEIDVNVRYFATDYLTFRLGMGWLLDANALGKRDDISVALFQAIIDF